MTEATSERKVNNLWWSRTLGLFTFLSLLIGIPIVIATRPEATYLVPVWGVGLLAAGLISVHEG